MKATKHIILMRFNDQYLPGMPLIQKARVIQMYHIPELDPRLENTHGTVKTEVSDSAFSSL